EAARATLLNTPSAPIKTSAPASLSKHATESRKRTLTPSTEEVKVKNRRPRKIFAPAFSAIRASKTSNFCRSMIRSGRASSTFLDLDLEKRSTYLTSLRITSSGTKPRTSLIFSVTINVRGAKSILPDLSYTSTSAPAPASREAANSPGVEAPIMIIFMVVYECVNRRFDFYEDQELRRS